MFSPWVERHTYPVEAEGSICEAFEGNRAAWINVSPVAIASVALQALHDAGWHLVPPAQRDGTFGTCPVCDPAFDGDPDEEGEPDRLFLGIDGTMGDAQDVDHAFIRSIYGAWCRVCGLAQSYRRHIDGCSEISDGN